MAHSAETKLKMRNAHLGKKMTDETRAKMSISAKRRFVSQPHPLLGKSRLDMVGPDNPNWSGGFSSLFRRFRRSAKYKQWRTECYKRDDYTCQKCLHRGVELNVDHIKPFALIIMENHIQTIEELYQCSELWNLENGRTLCVFCHRKTDTFGYGTKKLLNNLTTQKDN